MKKTTSPRGTVAVIYARYSSHQQRDVSIEQQVSACRQYAQQHGYTVLRVYDDHAMTGTNDNRPAFQQMIRDSASHAFDYVIVYTLDRFSRDRYDSAVHKHTLKENGVRVLSAMEHITDDPTGALMESVLEGFAEYYSKELAQKVRRGLNDNARRGILNVAPGFGYRRGADGKYEIIPAEADVVREVFSRVANGEQYASISRDLNQRGIRTKNGGEWGRSSYTYILQNENYIGVYNYADIRVEGAIPPIVDRETFDRVQEMRRIAKHGPQKRRRENGTYLLTGKLYCGECGAPMVGISGTSKTGDLHFYYVCKCKREEKRCHKRNVRRDDAEELVAQSLARMISDPQVVNWIADSVIKYQAERNVNPEVPILTERFADVQRKKQNVMNAILAGVLTPTVKDTLQQLEAEEADVAKKLDAARRSTELTFTREDVIAFLQLTADGDIRDKAYQERLIDTLLVRAYMYDDRLKLVCNFTDMPAYEVPINIEDDEGDEGEEVRIDSCSVHLCHIIRTIQIRMIAGFFVAVARLAE